MEATIDILWQVGFGLCLMIGLLLAVFQLPGTWFILLTTVVYDWHYDWQRIPWVALLAMGVLAVAAEVVDIFAGMKGAQRAGASRAASWGALIGGFCGMILFIPVPIPVFAPIVGGLLGCFVGAFIAERNVHGDPGKSVRVGFGAAVGRLVGLLIKLMTAFVMSGIALGAAIL